MVHEDLQFDEIKKVDNPIPHIEFVIPEEFHEVEYKVYLFSMLLKTIPQLQQVLCVEFSSFNALKLKVKFSLTKGAWCRSKTKIILEFIFSDLIFVFIS